MIAMGDFARVVAVQFPMLIPVLCVLAVKLMIAPVSYLFLQGTTSCQLAYLLPALGIMKVYQLTT